MKRKILSIFTAFFLMFTMTGCVKFNATMDIKKDKSMDFKITYAIDKQYFGDEELFEESDIKEMEQNGFTVTEYKDGNMEGITLSMGIGNIDEVSTTNDTDYNLSSVTEGNEENKYIFKVKKGIFKDTYVAKLKFDSADSSLNDETNYDEEYDYDYSYDEDYDYDYDYSYDEDYEDNSSDYDFSSMASMDLSFNVNLPYKSISNNATTVSEDGKSLKWSLTATDVSYIEFEFPMYNMTNIYIAAGVIVAIIIVIILFIICMKKGNKTKGSISSSVVTSEQNVNSEINKNSSTENVVNVEQQNVPTVAVNNVENSHQQNDLTQSINNNGDMQEQSQSVDTAIEENLISQSQENVNQEVTQNQQQN